MIMNVFENDGQNEGIASSSLVPDKSMLMPMAGDCCGAAATTGSSSEGATALQSKVPAVTRRVRFLEDVMLHSNDITRHDGDFDKNCTYGLLKSNSSTFTSFKKGAIMDFDDDASLDDALNDDIVENTTNEIEDSMSFSAVMSFAAEAATADVGEERRQHFRWACAPRTKKTATGEAVDF